MPFRLAMASGPTVVSVTNRSGERVWAGPKRDFHEQHNVANGCVTQRISSLSGTT